MRLIQNQQPDINKIFLYVKDTLEWKYQFLIIKREKVGIMKLKNPKAVIYYSQTIDNVYL